MRTYKQRLNLYAFDAHRHKQCQGLLPFILHIYILLLNWKKLFLQRVRFIADTAEIDLKIRVRDAIN